MKNYSYTHILSLLLIVTVLFIESCEKPVRVLSIKTLDVPTQDIAFENVVLKGELIDLGTDPIYNHGILIKTVSESDYYEMGEGQISTTGTFVTNFPNPELGTNYEYKAFAETSKGLFYGELKYFTSNSALIPSIKTNAIGDYTTTSFLSGGDITGDGGAPITARGVCWSTSTNPTTDDFSLEHGSQGIGHFDLEITELNPATEYFIKAFATNIAGTAYGNEVIFTTGWDVPSLETTGVITITTSSCDVGGGNIVENGQPIIDKGVCWSTSPNPELSDSYISLGVGGTGGFQVYVSTLDPDTEYYVRAYATNNMGTGYGNELSFTTEPVTVSDIDGNIYSTVKIGTQVWMAENLKVTAYPDGTSIPLVEGTTEWDELQATDEAYCWYDNNLANKEIYGGLYTWAALMNGSASSDSNPSGVQGICPDGWHLPSDSEWTELTDFLGGIAVAGGKLKETGNSHWEDPNIGATNESGFTALPSGYRHTLGEFRYINSIAYFCSSTEINATEASMRYINNSLATVRIGTQYKPGSGFPVRCIKD